ncbi:MAG: DNA polymerase III [Actinomycetia bacterium]|nr:DNA polymerase III [Actinomycetes bacterium]
MDPALFERELDRVPTLAPGYVVLDLETTGFDPRQDAILQVAAVAVGPEGVACWSSLVRPSGPVPDEVLRLTGLDRRALAAAPPEAEVLAALERFLEGRPVVGHNVGFDRDFLAARGIRPPVAADTLTWSRIAFPRRPSHRLEDFGDLVGPLPGGFHDATVDVLATLRLVAAIRHRLAGLGPHTRRALADLLGPEWDWWAVPHDGPGAESAVFLPGGEPEPEPEPVAGPVVEPAERWWAPDGPLARRHPGWERRPAQERLGEAVREALAARATLLAEAGTGLGKSLAYLLPAVAAAADGARVVIATHTVALQDQLWGKDVPEAVEALGVPGLARALVKGQGRYACLLKAEDVLEGARGRTLAPPYALAALVVWLAETVDGERDDWTAMRLPDGPALWEAVAADPAACARDRCRFAGPCYLRTSRRRAQTARILVVNHALLLAHAGLGGGVLPPFDHLVVDEAHRLPEAADHAFGFAVPLGATARRLEEWGARGGLVDRLEGVERLGGREAIRRGLGLAAGAVGRLAAALRAEAAGRGTETVRVRPEVDPLPEAAESARADAETALRGLAERMEGLVERARAELGAAVLDRAGWLGWARAAAQAAELAEVLAAFGTGADEWVDWWQVTGPSGDEVTIRRAPLNPAPWLRERLWEQVPGGKILVSATLRIGGRFDYLAEQLGLELQGLRTLDLASPFNVRERALLAVPSDFPDPREEAHLDRAGEFVARLAAAIGGRTLVLTTSRRAVLRLRERLGPVLERQGIQLWVQGPDGPAERLARRLRADPRSVVVGTASLWEGIDVPGPALSAVVVTRLPFAYPDDPLEAARLERIARTGRSAFWARTLPQAVLRFRQGFGRLLRAMDDRGAVVVLDPRLVGRPTYGRVFLDALGGPRLVVGESAALVETVSRFIGAGEDAACAF